MKIEVKDLRPNPFRHLERYPIIRDKVDALKRSIKDTEFWDNLLVRKAFDGDGYEIAYGHHRYIALKELRIPEIDVPVRKLDDTTMAKIMASENMEEWGWSANIQHETIRAVVEGFGEGRIELPKVMRDRGTGGNLRYAPSFGANSGRPEVAYSSETLAKFLGWKEAKVEAILSALAVVEKGLIKEEDFEGLTTYQAEQVARQTRRVEKETGKSGLARAVGRRLADGMRAATGQRPGVGGKPRGDYQPVTYHGARRAADEMMGEDFRKREHMLRPIPNAETFITALAEQIRYIPNESMIEKIERLIQVKEELPKNDRRGLVKTLRDAAKRFDKLANRLDG